jgi:two-component system sensor histidine kinase BaeS
MFGSLRARLVLSHIVPLLIVMPLMGLALIYVLETKMLLGSLSRELTEQGRLIASIAQDRPDIWHDPSRGNAFVKGMGANVQARVMLLDPDGTLIASSDPTDADRLDQRLDLAGWDTVLAGQTHAQTAYSQRMRQEIVDVLVPVVGADQQIEGVIRLSQHWVSVAEEFLQMRSVIAGVLVAGLLLGTAAGLVLALNLERPIWNANRAVTRIARGESLTPLPEQGPRETRELLHSVNILVERLHNVERGRRELLANLVHELGRPLGAVRAAIEAILRGAAREPAVQQELLEGIKDEIDRLKRLLDDLAGLHEQILGTIELDRRPTALGEWLAHTLAPWREGAQAKGLHWQVDVPRDLPIVDIDPERLGQALGNLISNAIKYTPRGGTVTTCAGFDGDIFWICVSDTGPGIEPEEQERIFAPFYRSQTGRRFPKGMGLGLSIARDLVTAHGGQLQLESMPGTGSQFTIRLPLISTQHPPD